MDPAQAIALTFALLLVGGLAIAWAWITVRDMRAGVRALDHRSNDLRPLIEHMKAEAEQRDALFALGFTDEDLLCNTVAYDKATGYPTTDYSIPTEVIEARAAQTLERRAAALRSARDLP